MLKEKTVKKEVIYHVYSIYAYWPHRDRAYHFYFEQIEDAK